MNRSELVRLVASQTSVDEPVVEDVLDGAIELITLTLAMDEAVALRGFGKFRPVHRAETTLRNPKTGEPVVVGPRLSAGFVPSSLLKRRLNNDPL